MMSELTTFCFLMYKTSRIHIAVGLHSNKSQTTLNVVRTFHLMTAAPRVPLFSSCFILMSSVISCNTEAWQNGIYFLTL